MTESHPSRSPIGAENPIAVVIPTIREPDRLRRCLDAARYVATEDRVEAEIMVVLDGPDPDVVDLIGDLPVGVTVLSWPERRGFAASLNAAFRATRCSEIVILQDDAMPQLGWLTQLRETARRYPRAGAVGSLVLSPEGIVQAAGAVIKADGWTLRPWTGSPPPVESFVEVRAVEYLGTASVLVKRSAWSAVGGFDEDFYPLYYVDADFCTALWHAGWLVLLDPGSVVRHEQHGSTTPQFRSLVMERNRARFLEKWGPFVADRLTGSPNAAEMDAAIARSARWIDHPPAVDPRMDGSPPVVSPPIVHVTREREVLRAFVAQLEPRLQSVEEQLAESQRQCRALEQVAVDRQVEAVALERVLDEVRTALDATRAELDATRSTITWRTRNWLVRRYLIRLARRALGALRARRREPPASPR